MKLYESKKARKEKEERKERERKEGEIKRICTVQARRKRKSLETLGEVFVVYDENPSFIVTYEIINKIYSEVLPEIRGL